jgi:HlyD family secretion protein
MQKAEEAPPSVELRHTLGLDRARHPARRRRVLVLGLVGLLAVGGLGYGLLKGDAKAPLFRTAPAERRTLVVRVEATGTLQPVNQVDVGSELSGVVRAVKVDYNDRVQAGQVLAELDADRLRAQALQSEAAVKSAEARVLQAVTTLGETREQYERVRALVDKNISSQQDLISAEAKNKRAEAEQAVARADVLRASAALNADRINLAKAVIRAPIDGIVLVRNVEPGQTVAAALQAPVLFVLAENLARMELLVDVDEADVGKVRAGQAATFTVDAHPNQPFKARVKQVRFASQTVAGVVTYKALLSVDNRTLLLRPGMTATANVTVQTVPDALVVPNAALRFTPPESVRQDAKASGGSRLFFWRRRAAKEQPPPEKAGSPPAEAHKHVVWALEGERPVAIPVKTGPTDGQSTQILSGDVAPGRAVLIDLADKAP